MIRILTWPVAAVVLLLLVPIALVGLMIETARNGTTSGWKIR